jgi:hypothetical protein
VWCPVAALCRERPRCRPLPVSSPSTTCPSLERREPTIS